MQYFFTDKKQLMLHHGDAFTWTIPLIAKSMKEMCLNLVEFTSSGPEASLQDEEEDEEFKELMEFVDNELNFTGKARHLYIYMYCVLWICICIFICIVYLVIYMFVYLYM